MSLLKDLTLRDKKILVTRPRNQANGLCQLIEDRGGFAIRYPAIEIVPVTTTDNHDISLLQLEDYDWIVFISVNAVSCALTTSPTDLVIPKKTKIAAIGAATAKALANYGVRVNLLPESSFNSQGLLQTSEMHSVEGQNFLIVRGVGGLNDLAEEIKIRGGRVTYLEVYTRQKPAQQNIDLCPLVRDKLLDVLTITSNEILQNLVEMVDESIKEPLKSIPLVVISERIKKLAGRMGFKLAIVAEQATDAAIVDAVIAISTGNNIDRIN